METDDKPIEVYEIEPYDDEVRRAKDDNYVDI